jgi:hypothetical protein
MSILRVIITFFLVLGSFLTLKSQEEITFDRPGITDLYNITTKNKFQFEVGYDYLSFIEKQESYPSFTIRYGINKKTELRYIFDYSFYNDNMIKNYDSNNVNLQCLGLKKHIVKFKNNVNVSLILNAKIPLNLNQNFYGFDAIAVIQKEFNTFGINQSLRRGLIIGILSLQFAVIVAQDYFAKKERKILLAKIESVERECSDQIRMLNDEKIEFKNEMIHELKKQIAENKQIKKDVENTLKKINE